MTASTKTSPAASLARGRAPDFFIVGHPKSGTSAMYSMLRSYPQIHMPRKEPSFFVPELLTNSVKYGGGIADYLALFDDARPEQLIGESTTSYLWSKMAAARIAEVQPEARIIVILREPASFLHSLHLQFLRSDVETERSLRTAMALEKPRSEAKQLPRNSTRPQLLAYAEHVRYVEQLRRYHAVFPPDQVLVLIYDDFRADNEGTVRQVLRFLEIDDASPVEVVETNLAAGVRSPRVNELVRSLYLGNARGARAARSAIKAVTSQQTRHRAIAAVRRAQSDRPPAPDPELMRELRERFASEVVVLSEYLNRDLVSFWKYDDCIA